MPREEVNNTFAIIYNYLYNYLVEGLRSGRLFSIKAYTRIKTSSGKELTEGPEDA
ncbi:hypothetical protein ES703_24544 [subsurface metagenome]